MKRPVYPEGGTERFHVFGIQSITLVASCKRARFCLAPRPAIFHKVANGYDTALIGISGYGQQARWVLHYTSVIYTSVQYCIGAVQLASQSFQATYGLVVGTAVVFATPATGSRESQHALPPNQLCDSLLLNVLSSKEMLRQESFLHELMDLERQVTCAMTAFNQQLAPHVPKNYTTERDKFAFGFVFGLGQQQSFCMLHQNENVMDYSGTALKALW